MEGFDKKTIKVSRGFTYTYYVSDSTHKTDSSQPALLFTHGWPDDAHMWEGIAKGLRDLPFKLIIPDLLGYDGTDKPKDEAAYKWDAMTKDLTEICDAENTPKVIPVGHDWGSAVAARFYNYHPDRCSGLVLLNVVYLPPSKDKFDLDAVNAMTEQVFGYGIYQYWHFFTSPEAPELLKTQIERLYAALHSEGTTAMKDFFTNPGAFPKFLNGDQPLPEVREYAKDPAFKKYHIDRLSRDGFEGAQNYYKAFKNNVQWECDKDLPAERAKVNVPLLYIGCDQDAVCRPEAMIPAKQAGLVPDLEETPIIHCAHWSPYEAPKECSNYIADWLKRRFVK